MKKSEQTVCEEEFRQIISVEDIAIASREVRTTEGLSYNYDTAILKSFTYYHDNDKFKNIVIK